MKSPTHDLINTTEAIILVKAFPQIGGKHGETVCVAGITLSGEWVRLFPVSFRKLEDAKQFRRWDIVRFSWRVPTEDHRLESRHVLQNRIEIIGHVPHKDREKLLAPLEQKGVLNARSEGKSLALIRPTVLKFKIDRKSNDVMKEETAAYESAVKQIDMFDDRALKPIAPCPYSFSYQYSTEDGDRVGTCQDWEIQATFYNWSNRYGENKALEEIQRVFGEEYPRKGMLFAMGTHSRWPETWLINGIIRMDEVNQMHLPFYT
jgi:hypothetical protein